MRKDKLTLLRREVEDTIERLLAFLDRMDGDPDLEPMLGAVEPSASHGRADQTLWGFATASDDREDDGDDREPPGWATHAPDWPPMLYVRQWGADHANYAPLAIE